MNSFVAVAVLASLAGVMCTIPEPFAVGKHTYYGHYPGKCANDGFYYNDDFSFVICSNNNAYVQPCAPGTRNGGPTSFFNGAPYAHGDFCQVNLNDFGYGLHHARPAYAKEAAYVKEPAYVAAPAYVREPAYVAAPAYQAPRAYY